jgi:uncharacterized protein YndB with AHSA1/START domain
MTGLSDDLWAGSPSLHLRRHYPVGAARVFEAFTDPALLRQWWKPAGFTVETLDFPAREGATYRVRLRAPDGTSYAHTGTILKVDPPTTLVYTWKWTEGPLDPAETLVEITFIEDDGGVIVDVRHSRFANQDECDKHVGWEQALDGLAGWLRSRR